MKAKNLTLLQENGIPVPPFIVVESEEEIDLSFSDSALFAVRSSAASEDGAHESYAGQFDTVLNVPREEVKEAVRKVLKSAEAENVGLYREAAEKGAQEAEGGNAPKRMRVVIQEMLKPQLSGVLFTANPAGILNESVIVVGRGLGEGVVRDEVPVTTYYYNRDDHRSMFVKSGDSPEIHESGFQALMDAGEKIEGLLGCPADIEFAVSDDRLYILQARPITTLPSEGKRIVLDSSNIVESYPGVSLPVTQDFAKDIYYHVFRNCLLRLSKDIALVSEMDDNLRHMVDTANGRIYYRISSWYDILELLPFSKKIIEIWQNSLGVKNRLVTSDRVKAGARTKLRITGSFFHYLFSCPKDMAALNRYFDERIGPLRAELAAADTREALRALYEKLLLEITEKWDITLVNDVYTFLWTAIAGKKNRESLADVGNLESMKPSKELSALQTLWKEKGEGEAFERAFTDYIERWGDRCVEDLKLETRTWRTNPENLRWILTEIEMHDPNAERPEESRKDKTELPTPDKNKPRKKGNGFALRRAKTGIANREMSRMNRSRLFGVMREIILKSGRILAEEGRLEEARDVMFLRLDEIFAEALSDGKALKALVAERKQEAEFQKNLPAFERLVFAERICEHREPGLGSRKPQESGALAGIPVSYGSAEGEVLVIRDPKEAYDTKGKILVTVSTDPGWVHLLRDAAGIIAERGSILSHTAIIARELQKPSIVNVSGATERLHDGDLVRLDTKSGRIEVLESSGAKE